MNIASLKQWLNDAGRASLEARTEIEDGHQNNHINVTEEVKQEVEQELLTARMNLETAESLWATLRKPTPYAKYYCFAGKPTPEERAENTRQAV